MRQPGRPLTIIGAGVRSGAAASQQGGQPRTHIQDRGQSPANFQGARAMISIVVPAYNEERNLDVLYARLLGQLEKLRLHWELVIVDDGSPDGTWNTIMRLSERDSRVRGVRLSRNFGHQNALLAGLAAARGKAVISMDADLQHPPEVVPQLVERWQDGYQIVHALRRDPPSVPYFKRLTSKLYYRMFSYLS